MKENSREDEKFLYLPRKVQEDTMREYVLKLFKWNNEI